MLASRGEIVGTLKQMHDEMSADFKEAEDAENKAIKACEGLMAKETTEDWILGLEEQGVCSE